MKLYDWCINNGIYGNTLLNEWTGIECGKDSIISISEVSHGSGRRFYWRCSVCNKIWDIDIHNRTLHKSGCPFCNGKRVNQDENGLYNWALNNNKDILTEWVGTDAEGNEINIMDFTYSSNKIVTWKCKQGHIWNASINNRTAKNSKCKYCSNVEQSIIKRTPKSFEKSLKYWCDINGIRGKQLELEWVGKLENGDSINIQDIGFYSNARVHWKCSRNHMWISSVYSRTKRHTNCSICSNSGTSYPEKFIYYALKQVYTDAENRVKVLKDKYSGGIEYDIMIKSLKLCIEYSPLSTHSYIGSQSRSDLKRKICTENGYKYIEIVDTNDINCKESYTDDLIIFYYNYNDNKLIDIIHYIIGESINKIDFKTVEELASCSNIDKIDERLDILREEWSSLNSIDISKALIKKLYYWECKICGYGSNGEWKASLNNRRDKKSGCPICGSNILKGIDNSKKLLKNVHPKLFKELSKLNGNVNGVLAGSSKRDFYWECNNCGYGKNGEWISTVASRIYSKSVCRKCKHNIWK